MIKLAKSFSHAYAGLSYALKYERNFRIQWQCALMVFLLNALVKFSLWQAFIFLAMTFLVLSCELINCAIEKVCNSTGLEFSAAKKHAKDFAAASVMLMSIAALVTLFLLFKSNVEIILSSMKNLWPAWLFSTAIFALHLSSFKQKALAHSTATTILLGALVFLLKEPSLFLLLAFLFHGALIITLVEHKAAIRRPS